MKCPGGAIGACQIDHSADGKGFNLGYVQSNPQVAADGELSLQYSGGSECHHQFNRSIRIVFSCAETMVRSGVTKGKKHLIKSLVDLDTKGTHKNACIVWVSALSKV